MARLAAPLVAPGGFLLVASCSHHAPLEAWAGQIAFGLHRARREGRILFTGGAGPDHPVHPHLPETAYLKTQLIQLL
jgi:23S rRNA (cytosine1962-C5)-methyltransferase